MRVGSLDCCGHMPELIEGPSRVEAAGTKPKLIDEYVGRVNTGEDARERGAHALAGRLGGARPAAGVRRVHARARAARIEVEHEGGTLSVAAGQAVLTRAGEWVRYSTPEGAEYIAVCLPAFSPDTVHRDES